MAVNIVGCSDVRLFRREKIISVLPCTQTTHSRTPSAREPLQAVPLLRQTMHKTMRNCGVKVNVFPQKQNKVLTRTCSYLKHKSHTGRQTECETSAHCHSAHQSPYFHFLKLLDQDYYEWYWAKHKAAVRQSCPPVPHPKPFSSSHLRRCLTFYYIALTFH